MNFYSNKTCRRYGIVLKDSPKEPSVRRNFPPGIHGPKGRGRMTEYGMQLAEKQRAKVTYNLREKQFRLTFDRAAKMKGDAGQNFLQLLERRLDNVVYRMGLAQSRPQARQLVSHCHITVNGKVVNIPSFTVKTGDIIAVRSKSVEGKLFRGMDQRIRPEMIPGWLHFEMKKLEAKVLHAPAKEDMEQKIDAQAIVEYYSRR